MSWLHEGMEPYREFLTRVSYKDWRFTIDQDRLLIRMRTEDSLRPGVMTEIGHAIPVPMVPFGEEPKRAEKLMRLVLMRAICDVEAHEAMELFKVDGEAPFFPDHKTNAYAMVDRFG